MYITALIITPPKWIQPKCSSTGKWINQGWYIHKMEYYSEGKRKNKLTDICNNIDESQIVYANFKKQTKKNTGCM